MVLKYGLLVVAYLLGAIPFSIILGRKYKGIDVREHGSGNPGGTNSLRFLGKKIGLWVLFLDALKAMIIVLLVKIGIFDSLVAETGVELFHPLAYGVAAAVGHVYSIYIKFKGGKAVACTVGMMVGFNIIYAVIMALAFFIILKTWKFVSVASTGAVFTLVVIGAINGIVGNGWEITFFGFLLLLLVSFRHKKNFKNIKDGNEPKVTWI